MKDLTKKTIEIVKFDTFESIKNNVLSSRTIIKFNYDDAVAEAQERSSYHYPVLVRERLFGGKFNEKRAYAIPV